MTVSTIPTANIESSEQPQLGKPAKPQPDLLDHQYDGIQEYDNPLPRWWVLIFWGSIVFSVGYFFHFHISHNGASVAAAYSEEMESARKVDAQRSLGEKVSQDSLEKLSRDSVSMGEAKAMFTARCAPCHGPRGQGLIGPNLTDQFWIHGDGQLMAIYSVVNDGVAEKGMPAWGKQLPQVEIRKLAAFVGGLRAEYVPGKTPEGSKFE